MYFVYDFIIIIIITVQFIKLVEFIHCVEGVEVFYC